MSCSPTARTRGPSTATPRSPATSASAPRSRRNSCTRRCTTRSTGLPNRVLFADRLAQALSRAGRFAGSLAVLLLDLDHFKLVNDAYGHDVGDDLLIRAAVRIRGALRQGDTVARFGGDEFAVLCEDVRGSTKVDAIADRLAIALAEPFELAGGRVFLTASVGIALTDEFPTTAESLLGDADTAMNRAKERGRARAEVFVEDLWTSAVRRLRTADDLHRALEQEEFRVVYQPEVDLRNRHVPAVEALIRWHQPERGLVPPDEFVPLAEQTGLIDGIGAWVLDGAVAQAAEWSATLAGGSPIVWVDLRAAARRPGPRGRRPGDGGAAPGRPPPGRFGDHRERVARGR